MVKPLALGGRRTALVVAPHPDDETIGAYGLIARLARRGVRVRVIVVADGAASHTSSNAWPRARLVAERRRETRIVLRRIGVRAGDVRFLALPDGALPDDEATHGVALARAIRSVRRPGLVALPDPCDAHPDHRAVARMAARVATPGARRVHYLVWPERGAPRPRPTHGLTLGPLRAAKRAAILRYRTQCGAITDDPHGFAISRGELARFARPVELYRTARW